MATGEPRVSAVFAAAARHLHATADAERPVHDDAHALALSGLAGDHAARAWVEGADRPAVARVCAYYALRQRVFEECLVAALQDGVEQVVILHAGLDSFGLRHPRIVERLAWFEVDAADTQSWKRERIEILGLESPSIRYVAWDGAEPPLGEALARQGFDLGVCTCVSWLGATPLLAPEAASQTLRWFLQLPAGSELVFDVLIDDRSLSADEAALGRVYAEAAAAGGTPWVSSYAPGELEEQLFAMGFQEVERLGPEMAERYYLGQPAAITPVAVWQVVRVRVG